MMAPSRGAGADCSGLAVAPSAARPGHPAFEPYRPLRDELLGLPPGRWIAHCSRLAEAHGLRSAGGAPLRFVADCEPQGALDYEAAIFHEGRIACRTGGRGAMHDLHNALVWLSFPAVKATLNRLHVESLADLDGGGPSRRPRGGGGIGQGTERAEGRGRGRLRDLATLLDESGLLWLSGDATLDARLLARDWRGLLVVNRELLAAEVRPIVIGHGLLEKLAAPYKAMTAHCLPCRAVRGQHSEGAESGSAAGAAGAAGVTGGGGSAAAAGAVQAQAADARDSQAAACVAAAFSGGGVPKLAPLPILGLPGWDPANVDPSYYDDVRVFRA